MMIEDDFNFDLERMKQAVESEKVSIPTEALASFEAFDAWLNDGENGYARLRDRLPNPFAVDYQHETGPLDLYTEVEMLKFAESIIKESIDALNKHCEYLDYGNDHDTGYKQGFENAIDFLTGHFGL
jgi:hypothetical protein